MNIYANENLGNLINSNSARLSVRLMLWNVSDVPIWSNYSVHGFQKKFDSFSTQILIVEWTSPTLNDGELTSD